MRPSGFIFLFVVLPAAAFGADPLPSWRDSPAKTEILDFVERVTKPGSPDFVKRRDRIAVFDNDGTLWSEKPVYFQVLFAMDRASQLAKANPDFATTPTLKAAAKGDTEAVLKGGNDALLEVVTTTHSGLTIDQFREEVRDWIADARHPLSGRRYTDMVYRPMLELLDHLRNNGFEIYIVSGGGIDFMRAFAEEIYGIPPENVIGSMGKARFTIVNSVPSIMKDPGIAFIDDKEGKPLGIARHIGKRPVFVAGNSDGDLAMARWATSKEGPSLALFVHHTDAAREFAYDRDTTVGRLDKALDEAVQNQWVIVDMARDWEVVWPKAD